MSFGHYLRDKRINAGLSLRDVASQLGLHVVILGEVERGIRALEPGYWPMIASIIEGIAIDDLEAIANGDGKLSFYATSVLKASGSF